jgi:hypothetical protein
MAEGMAGVFVKKRNSDAFQRTEVSLLLLEAVIAVTRFLTRFVTRVTTPGIARNVRVSPRGRKNGVPRIYRATI